MKRRQFLTFGGATSLVVLSGCSEPPGDDDGIGSEEVPVSITGQTDQPDVPVEYEVEMVGSVVTADQPARLRVTIENPTDGTVVLGEERDILFHHVTSGDDVLYLHPASEETWEGPVEPGCWRLTEYVAVPEYYGTISLQAGEISQAEAYVYGHPDLPEDSCLPEGDYQLRTNGIAGDDEESISSGTGGTEFDWSFTLRVG